MATATLAPPPPMGELPRLVQPKGVGWEGQHYSQFPRRTIKRQYTNVKSVTPRERAWEWSSSSPFHRSWTPSWLYRGPRNHKPTVTFPAAHHRLY